MATPNRTAQKAVRPNPPRSALDPRVPEWQRNLSGSQRDAYLAITNLFKSFGLGSLAPKIFEFVKSGYSADTISVLLQETKEYKERFAGNEIRLKQGLPVLSPAEYLATEASYKQIMQTAGMPAGFYDQASDFNDWIGKNISPSEIQSRVDMATQATILANPDYRKALNQMGISNSEVTAYFLDSKRAMPYLQKAAATAQIGAEALRQGMGFDVDYAGKLATEGVTAEQARSGYAQIGMEQQTLSTLGDIYGQEYGQRDAEEALIRGQAAALQRRQGLIGQERAAFSGTTGAARGGLAQRGGAV